MYPDSAGISKNGQWKTSSYGRMETSVIGEVFVPTSRSTVIHQLMFRLCHTNRDMIQAYKEE